MRFPHYYLDKIKNIIEQLEKDGNNSQSFIEFKNAYNELLAEAEKPQESYYSMADCSFMCEKLNTYMDKVSAFLNENKKSLSLEIYDSIAATGKNSVQVRDWFLHGDALNNKNLLGDIMGDISKALPDENQKGIDYDESQYVGIMQLRETYEHMEKYVLNQLKKPEERHIDDPNEKPLSEKDCKEFSRWISSYIKKAEEVSNYPQIPASQKVVLRESLVPLKAFNKILTSPEAAGKTPNEIFSDTSWVKDFINTGVPKPEPIKAPENLGKETNQQDDVDNYKSVLQQSGQKLTEYLTNISGDKENPVETLGYRTKLMGYVIESCNNPFFGNLLAKESGQIVSNQYNGYLNQVSFKDPETIQDNIFLDKGYFILAKESIAGASTIYNELNIISSDEFLYPEHKEVINQIKANMKVMRMKPDIVGLDDNILDNLDNTCCVQKLLYNLSWDTKSAIYGRTSNEDTTEFIRENEEIDNEDEKEKLKRKKDFGGSYTPEDFRKVKGIKTFGENHPFVVIQQLQLKYEENLAKYLTGDPSAKAPDFSALETVVKVCSDYLLDENISPVRDDMSFDGDATTFRGFLNKIKESYPDKYGAEIDEIFQKHKNKVADSIKKSLCEEEFINTKFFKAIEMYQRNGFISEDDMLRYQGFISACSSEIRENCLEDAKTEISSSLRVLKKSLKGENKDLINNQLENINLNLKRTIIYAFIEKQMKRFYSETRSRFDLMTTPGTDLANIFKNGSVPMEPGNMSGLIDRLLSNKKIQDLLKADLGEQEKLLNSEDIGAEIENMVLPKNVLSDISNESMQRLCENRVVVNIGVYKYAPMPSPEFKAVRNAMTELQAKNRNIEEPTADDYMKAFRACANYLNLKDPSPFSDTGKHRFEASSEILLKFGEKLREMKPEFKGEIERDLKNTIVRSAKFRQMVASSALSEDLKDFAAKSTKELGNKNVSDKLKTPKEVEAFSKKYDYVNKSVLPLNLDREIENGIKTFKECFAKGEPMPIEAAKKLVAAVCSKAAIEDVKRVDVNAGTRLERNPRPTFEGFQNHAVIASFAESINKMPEKFNEAIQAGQLGTFYDLYKKETSTVVEKKAEVVSKEQKNVGISK